MCTQCPGPTSRATSTLSALSSSSVTCALSPILNPSGVAFAWQPSAAAFDSLRGGGQTCRRGRHARLRACIGGAARLGEPLPGCQRPTRLAVRRDFVSMAHALLRATRSTGPRAVTAPRCIGHESCATCHAPCCPTRVMLYASRHRCSVIPLVMVPLTFLLIPDAKLTDDLLDQVLPSSQARALVLPPALHPPARLLSPSFSRSRLHSCRRARVRSALKCTRDRATLTRPMLTSGRGCWPSGSFLDCLAHRSVRRSAGLAHPGSHAALR